jgi:hypothetical protein
MKPEPPVSRIARTIAACVITWTWPFWLPPRLSQERPQVSM